MRGARGGRGPEGGRGRGNRVGGGRANEGGVPAESGAATRAVPRLPSARRSSEGMRGMSRGRHQPPPPQQDHNLLFVPPQAQPVVIPVPLPGPRRPAPAGCEAPEPPGARGGGASHAPRRGPGLGAAPAARRPAPPPEETRLGPWKAKAAPLKGKKAAATTESLLRPRGSELALSRRATSKRAKIPGVGLETELG